MKKRMCLIMTMSMGLLETVLFASCTLSSCLFDMESKQSLARPNDGVLFDMGGASHNDERPICFENQQGRFFLNDFAQHNSMNNSENQSPQEKDDVGNNNTQAIAVPFFDMGEAVDCALPFVDHVKNIGQIIRNLKDANQEHLLTASRGATPLGYDFFEQQEDGTRVYKAYHDKEELYARTPRGSEARYTKSVYRLREGEPVLGSSFWVTYDGYRITSSYENEKVEAEKESLKKEEERILQILMSPELGNLDSYVTTPKEMGVDTLAAIEEHNKVNLAEKPLHKNKAVKPTLMIQGNDSVCEHHEESPLFNVKYALKNIDDEDSRCIFHGTILYPYISTCKKLSQSVEKDLSLDQSLSFNSPINLTRSVQSSTGEGGTSVVPTTNSALSLVSGDPSPLF